MLNTKRLLHSSQVSIIVIDISKMQLSKNQHSALCFLNNTGKL